MENLKLNEMARNLILNYMANNQDQVVQEIILSSLQKHKKGLTTKQLQDQVKKTLKKYKKVVDLLESM